MLWRLAAEMRNPAATLEQRHEAAQEIELLRRYSDHLCIIHRCDDLLRPLTPHRQRHNMLTVDVPGKPFAKGRPRFSKNGHTYTPEATARYENLVRVAAYQAMRGKAPLEGPLLVVVLVALPVPESWSRKKRVEALNGDIQPTGRPDADNYAKMLDGLNGIVWLDDSQVTTLAVVKRYDATPRMRVTVMPRSPETQRALADVLSFV
jgi:Holliday junction resolvase RusA-like endonuclease